MSFDPKAILNFQQSSRLLLSLITFTSNELYTGLKPANLLAFDLNKYGLIFPNLRDYDRIRFSNPAENHWLLFRVSLI